MKEEMKRERVDPSKPTQVATGEGSRVSKYPTKRDYIFPSCLIKKQRKAGENEVRWQS